MEWCVDAPLAAQVSTIWSILLRDFDLEMITPVPHRIEPNCISFNAGSGTRARRVAARGRRVQDLL